VGWSADVDALIVSPRQVGEALARSGDQAVLAEVANPFQSAQLKGLELNRLLETDPTRGEELLRSVITEVRSQIKTALEKGADGIFYKLYGAEPSLSTPMQYGGHYLERDRELLSEIEDARFNLLFVVGGPETYFDFVSDLPAHSFGWNADIAADEIRRVRGGALASTSGDAEILIVPPQPNLTEYLENQTLAGV
jgi:hypothetical protein